MTATLSLVPVSFADARGFVAAWHRHHVPPIGHKFSLGVAAGDVLVGVAIVGRPVARHLQDGHTLEVTRTATDGTLNANSMLYGASWRAAKALGYSRLITYTQPDTCADCDHQREAHDSACRANGCHCAEYLPGETGASLRAAGFRVIGERRSRSGWNTPSRPRDDRGADGVQRYLWEASA